MIVMLLVRELSTVLFLVANGRNKFATKMEMEVMMWMAELVEVPLVKST